MRKIWIPSSFFIALLLSTVFVYPMQVSATYQMSSDQFPDQPTDNAKRFLCQSAYTITIGFQSMLADIFSTAAFFSDVKKVKDLGKAGKIAGGALQAYGLSGLGGLSQNLATGLTITNVDSGWYKTAWAIGGVLISFAVLSALLVAIFALFGAYELGIKMMSFLWGMGTNAYVLAGVAGVPGCGPLLVKEGKEIGDAVLESYIENLDYVADGNPEFANTPTTKYQCGVFVAYPKNNVNRGDQLKTFGTIAPNVPYSIGYAGGVPEFGAIPVPEWPLPIPWPAGITFRDTIWDTNLNEVKPGITNVGSISYNAGTPTESLNADLTSDEKVKIRAVVNDLLTKADFPKKSTGPKGTGTTGTNVDFDIFFLNEQKARHTIGFSASHFTVQVKAASALLNYNIQVSENNSPIVVPPEKIQLEKTFPDGAYVPPSFEDRLIEQSTPKDDCTPTNEMTVTTNLYSKLNSQGRLPPGETVVTLFTEDRWGNKGESPGSVFVVDTIPPDIHPMDPVGVTIPVDATEISGSTILNSDYPNEGDIALLQEPFSFDLGSLNQQVECFVGDGTQSCASYDFPIANTDIRWEVSDTVGNTSEIFQEIRVRTVSGEHANNPPSGVAMQYDVAKGVSKEILIPAIDADWDKLKFTIKTPPEFGGLQAEDIAIFQDRFVSEGNINDFSSFEVVVKSGINNLSNYVSFVNQSEHDRIMVYNNRIGLIDIIDTQDIGIKVDEIITSPTQGSYKNAVDFWTVGWSDRTITNVFYCHDYGTTKNWPCKESQMSQVDKITLPDSLGVPSPHSMTTDGENFYFLGDNNGKIRIVKVVPASISVLENIDTNLNYSENTYLTFCGVQCGGSSLLLANWDEKTIVKLSTLNARQLDSWDKFEFEKEVLENNQTTIKAFDMFEPEDEGVEPKLMEPAGISVVQKASKLSVYIGDSKKSNIVIVQLGSDKAKLISDDNFGMKFVEINALETDYDDDLLLADNQRLTKFAYGGTLLAHSVTKEGKPTNIPLIDVVAAPDYSIFVTGLDSEFSNSNIITELLQKTLKRNPSPIELENYVSKLNSGTSLDDIRKEIQQTFEFKSKAGGMLEEIYLKYYGEEMTKQIVGGESIKVNTGFTKQQWIDSMIGVDGLRSFEDRENYLKNYDAAGKYFVKQLHNEYLDREASSGEETNWFNVWNNNNKDRSKTTLQFIKHPDPVQIATTKINHLYQEQLGEEPASGDARFSKIETVQNVDGSLELFGIGNGGTIQHKSQIGPNGPWSDWELIKEGSWKNLAVGQNQDGSWTVLAADKNNALRSFTSTTDKIVLSSGADTAVSPLIINGDFEWGPQTNSFTTINAGSTDLAHWVIEDGSIDHVINWQDAHGNYSLDMDGSMANGSISQSFPTESGSEYQVTFWMAGNANQSYELEKGLRVTAASDSKNFEFNIKDKTYANMGWEKKTFDFTADSEQTTLTFTNLSGPSSFGATLDDVSVVQKNPTSFAEIVPTSTTRIADAHHITNAAGDQLIGTVTYSTTFELPSQFENPSIGIQAQADDSASIYLNGHKINGEVDLHSVKSFTHDESTHFESGENTLDFVVRNVGGPANLIYKAIVTFDTPNQDYTKWNQIYDSEYLDTYVQDIEVVTRDDGRLGVFAVGTGGSPYYKWQTPGGGWSNDWISLGGKLVDMEIGKNQDGSLIAFGFNANKTPFRNVENAPNSDEWSSWKGWGSYLSDIAVVTKDDGRLGVFAVGGGNQPVYNVQNTINTDDWSGWNKMGGTVVDIEVGENKDGRLEAVAFNKHNTLFHNVQNTANSDDWSGWDTMGGVVSDIVVGENKDGLLEVIGIGKSAKNIVHTWQMPNGEWTPNTQSEKGMVQFVEWFKEGATYPELKSLIREETFQGLNITDDDAITEFYLANLSRYPTAQDLEDWKDLNLSQERVEFEIRNSEEAKNIAISKIHNLSQANQNRDATDAELAQFLEQFKNAGSYDHLFDPIFDQIELEMRASADAQTFATQRINQLYNENLDRDVDPSGLSYYLQLFNEGKSFEFMESEISKSDEAKNNHKYFILEFNGNLELQNQTNILETTSSGTTHETQVTRITVDPINAPHTPHFIENNQLYRLVSGDKQLIDIENLPKCDEPTKTPIDSKPLDIDFLLTGTPSSHFAFVLTENQDLHKIEFNTGMPQCVDSTIQLGLYGNPRIEAKIFEVDVEKSTLYVVKPRPTDDSPLIPEIIKLASNLEILQILKPGATGLKTEVENFLLKGDFADVVDVAFSTNEAFVAEGAPLHRVHFFDTNPLKKQLSPVIASTIYHSDEARTDSFTFTVNDAFEESSETTITLNVVDDTTKPIITNYISLTDFALTETEELREISITEDMKDNLEYEIMTHAKSLAENPVVNINYETNSTDNHLADWLDKYPQSYQNILDGNQSEFADHTQLVRDVIDTSTKLAIADGNNQCLVPLTLEAEKLPFEANLRTIEIAKNEDGRLEQVGIGKDNAVYHRWQVEPNSDQWSIWNSLGGQVSEIEIIHENDKRLSIFAVNSDASISYTSQLTPNGELWSDWQGVGGYLIQEIALGMDSNGRLVLFAVGPANETYHILQNSDGTWGPERNWDHGHGGWIRDIELFTNPHGGLELVGIGGDNAVYNKYQPSPGSENWSNWSRLHPWVKDISIAMWDNRPHIYGIGGDDQLYQLARTHNSGWSTWHALGGGPFTDIVAANDENGTLNIFTNGNGISHKNWTGSSWMEWENFGGDAVDFAVGNNKDGTIQVFYLDADGKVFQLSQKSINTNSWSSWLTEESSAFRQVESIENRDGKIELFAIGNDASVYYKFPLEDQTLSDWINLGGWLSEMVLTQNSDGSLEIFGIGKNNEVYHKWEIKQHEWSDWASLGGWASTIQVGKNSDGRLEVFTIGSDSSMSHRWQTPDGKWSPDWQDFGGNAIDIAVGQNEDGDLSVFHIGQNKNLIVQTQQENAVVWSNPKEIAPCCVIDIEVGQTHDNRLEVFGTGTNNALYSVFQETANGDEWSNQWAKFGGYTWLTDMVVTQNQNGQLMNFHIGGEGKVYYKTQNNDGTWPTDHWKIADNPNTTDFSVGKKGDGSLEIFTVSEDGSVLHVPLDSGGTLSNWVTEASIVDNFKAVSVDEHPNFEGSVPFHTTEIIKHHLDYAILLDDFDNSPEIRATQIKTVFGENEDPPRAPVILPVDPSSRLPIGTNYVTIAAIDSTGNQSKCDWEIVVQDSSPPIFGIIPTHIEEVAGILTTLDETRLGIPEVFDAVDSNVTIINNISSDGYAVGLHDLEWTATDFSGNTVSAIQKIEILDEENPIIAEVDPITVPAINGYATSIDYDVPEATDLGGILQQTVCSPSPENAAFPPGQHQILCNAKDNGLNVGFQTIDVTITTSDDNDDGIINIISTENDFEFSDQTIGGDTFGKITKPIENKVQIIDELRKSFGVMISTGINSAGVDDDMDGTIDEEIVNGVDDDGDELVDEDTSNNFGDDYAKVSVCGNNDIEIYLDAANSISVSCLDKILLQGIFGDPVAIIDGETFSAVSIPPGSKILFDPATKELQSISNLKYDAETTDADLIQEITDNLLDKIYLGEITQWDDNSITSLIPELEDYPSGTIVDIEPLQDVYENSDLECVKANFGLKNVCSAISHTIVLSSGVDTAVSPLIINGDFEWGPQTNSFTTINAGSTDLAHWVIEDGSIDHVINWQDAHGNYSLDMDGSMANGSISQSFATESGSEYQVTFWMAGNANQSYELKKGLKVTAASDSETFEFDITGKTYNDMGWEKKTFDFTADSDQTTLTFTNLSGPSSFGATLDDVSVVQKNPTSFAEIVTTTPTITDSHYITNAAGDQLIGTVTYSTTFELPSQFENPSIGIQAQADDSASIYLNGHKIDGEVILSSVKSFTHDESTHFESGENTLDFVVRNVGGPAGLIYKATINVEPVGGS